LWRASRTQSPGLASHRAAVTTLLATSNIALWQIFVLCDVLMLGYVSTSLHIVFALLQFAAAVAATRRERLAIGAVLTC
jgi:hypothetical protein